MYSFAQCTIHRNQCAAEMYAAWLIWSRDLAASTLGTYPTPYLPGYWGLSLLVALNKDRLGQCSGHVQEAQPRTRGPRKMYVNIVLYFPSRNDFGMLT